MHGWVVASLFTLPAPAGTIRMNHSVPEQLCIKSKVFRKSFGSPCKKINVRNVLHRGFVYVYMYICIYVLSRYVSVYVLYVCMHVMHACMHV
jgi:hypothetical protein